MKVVILAGGMGTRISEESYLRPKPMIDIGNQPILWHIMKHYSHYGFKEFIICCGYKGNIIKDYFNNYFLYTSDVTIDLTNDSNMVIHRSASEPWKVTLVDTGLHTMTGGRIKRISEYIKNDTFMLTYGDGVSNVDLDKLLVHHRASGRALTITVVQPKGRFGIVDIDEQDNVLGFTEKPDTDGSWINAGFMVMEPRVLDYIREGDKTVLEKFPFESLAQDNEMAAYKHNGFWQCMDTRRDMGVLQTMWEAGNAPWKVWEN